ncbi:MAG TPA: hypoxanthine phosphoribosyltransferase [Firmicutes bacterium]|nr:hypoxanthine phosphoribosyltransferase [Bacillota bacterium]
MDIVKRVLVTEEEIQNRVRELGAQISKDYEGKEILLLCILKGGLMFLADLAKHISVPVTMDFIGISSYGHATRSSGVVRITKDLEESIEGKHVLIIEDIIDSGLTLSYLMNNLAIRKPASLKICTLLDKQVNREVDIPVDYVGFTVPNEFLVGYGLDFCELYRNIPYIFVLDPKYYTSEME